MDIDLARHIVRTAFHSGRELEELLGPLKEQCGEDEYDDYAKAIATAIAAIQLEVMNRALASHPDLEKEIEASIATFGRYR
jgi:hypothetical protein